MFRSLWSLPLFRLAGLRVRADLFLLAYIASELARAGLVDRALLGPTLAAMGILFLSLLLHEIGHVTAARREGGEASEIVLWPLGGFADLRLPHAPGPHFRTALAGPAVNLLLAGLGFALMRIQGHALDFAGVLPWKALPLGTGPWWQLCLVQTNLTLALFNLIPAFPLDGGQALRAGLWNRHGFQAGTLAAVRLGKGVAVLLGVVGLTTRSLMLILIAILNFVACEQERLALAFGTRDGDDWGPPLTERAPERRPGWLERWQAGRRERRERARLTREEAVRARVDGILDRINQVGMQGLTDEERAILKEASDVYKHSRK